MNEDFTFEEHFNRHYIRTDERNRIVRGFSDAFKSPLETDILIEPEGGHQFRLFPGGEENPPLFNMEGIPLYRWDGGKVLSRSESEIDVDLKTLSEATQPPSLEERLKILEEAVGAAAVEWDMMPLQAAAMSFGSSATDFSISAWDIWDESSTQKSDNLHSMECTEPIAPIAAAMRQLVIRNAGLGVRLAALEGRVAALEAASGIVSDTTPDTASDTASTNPASSTIPASPPSSTAETKTKGR